ncbi:hypothetical protein K6H10_003160 [Candida tropicalis]
MVTLKVPNKKQATISTNNSSVKSEILTTPFTLREQAKKLVEIENRIKYVKRVLMDLDGESKLKGLTRTRKRKAQKKRAIMRQLLQDKEDLLNCEVDSDNESGGSSRSISPDVAPIDEVSIASEFKIRSLVECVPEVHNAPEVNAPEPNNVTEVNRAAEANNVPEISNVPETSNVLEVNDIPEANNVLKSRAVKEFKNAPHPRFQHDINNIPKSNHRPSNTVNSRTTATSYTNSHSHSGYSNDNRFSKPHNNSKYHNMPDQYESYRNEPTWDQPMEASSPFNRIPDVHRHKRMVHKNKYAPKKGILKKVSRYADSSYLHEISLRRRSHHNENDYDNSRRKVEFGGVTVWS